MQEVDIKETVKQGNDSEIDDDIENEVSDHIFLGSRTVVAQTVRVHTLPYTRSQVRVPSMLVDVCTSMCIRKIQLQCTQEVSRCRTEVYLRNPLHRGDKVCN